MAKVEMIENTKEAKNNYGFLWGCTEHTVTKKQVQELLNGKVMAMNDGEYVTFVSLEKEV